MSVEPKPSAASRLLKADAPPHWTAAALGGVKHGFFGRQGGVSTGIYTSLNAGTGSGDDADATRENRRRIAAAFGASALVGVHQVHSPTAIYVDAPWQGERPHADALVTTRAGVVLSVLTADCAPILFSDPANGVIAAAHAGWKGALGGVIESTVRLMQQRGAAPGAVVAAIGPCIRQASYEVGPEFADQFNAADASHARFFVPGRNGKLQFDLPGFCASQLERAGVRQVEALPLDTYALPEALFSHRRSVHEKAGDYGRNCAAISL